MEKSDYQNTRRETLTIVLIFLATFLLFASLDEASDAEEAGRQEMVIRRHVQEISLDAISGDLGQAIESVLKHERETRARKILRELHGDATRRNRAISEAFDEAIREDASARAEREKNWNVHVR